MASQKRSEATIIGQLLQTLRWASCAGSAVQPEPQDLLGCVSVLTASSLWGSVCLLLQLQAASSTPQGLLSHRAACFLAAQDACMLCRLLRGGAQRV